MGGSSGKSRRTAVVAGATGLVGSALLARLLAGSDYDAIVALSRRELPLADPRLVTVPARFEDLDAVLDGVRGPALDVYCCLGTTIAKAGSQAAFRRIDHDAVVALARWSRAAGARRYLLVSALGADPKSRVFYNRVKGEAEVALRQTGPASVVVLRPGLLDGTRAEFRLGESLALALTRPLRKILPAALRPVAADDVAAAMLEAARATHPADVIESAAIQGAALRIG
jgi:uncharacterized protein YbjT (DUF2867 family)